MMASVDSLDFPVGLKVALARAMVTRPSGQSLSVTVIADNPKTTDGLRVYLSDAGLAPHASNALADACSLPKATFAAVIFPDEFEVDEVVSRLLELRAARPRLLILLVTSTPQRFLSALIPDGRSRPPTVLPKPAFGWTILDAIRAHRSEPS